RAQPLVMNRYLTRSMRGEYRGVTVAGLRYLIHNTPAPNRLGLQHTCPHCLGLHHPPQTASASNTPAHTASAPHCQLPGPL
ncbi:MAG: hypothetical protein AAFS10_03220, partial [Myxococcota bacterium]